MGGEAGELDLPGIGSKRMKRIVVPMDGTWPGDLGASSRQLTTGLISLLSFAEN